MPLRPQRGIRHGIFPYQSSQSSVTYTYVMNTNRHMDKVLWQHKRKETGSAWGVMKDSREVGLSQSGWEGSWGRAFQAGSWTILTMAGVSRALKEWSLGCKAGA